jgi:hypothetical protein|tara:strand:+ start:548 stop:805 length:258 start_codon:yes stop_codon:yes gene_type:complete
MFSSSLQAPLAESSQICASIAMAEPERTVERRIPRDAAVVMNILRDMGVTEWEPRVVNQLMEFIHRASRHPSLALAFSSHPRSVR